MPEPGKRPPSQSSSPVQQPQTTTTTTTTTTSSTFSANNNAVPDTTSNTTATSTTTTGSSNGKFKPFGTKELKNQLNDITQQGRVQTKEGRTEKAKPNNYVPKQIDFLHYMATPKGYFRGVYYEHDVVDFPYVIESSVHSFMKVVCEGFEFKNPRKNGEDNKGIFERKMENKEILAMIQDSGNGLWHMEYFNRVKKDYSTTMATMATAATTAMEKLEGIVNDRMLITNKDYTHGKRQQHQLYKPH
jgi:hypothetical protein